MTDMIERRAYLARLFDLYRPLLTEKQQTMFDLYHQCDLSLGEIAEETAISRQAVFDVIKRTENALDKSSIYSKQKTPVKKQWFVCRGLSKERFLTRQLNKK